MNEIMVSSQRICEFVITHSHIYVGTMCLYIPKLSNILQFILNIIYDYNMHNCTNIYARCT